MGVFWDTSEWTTPPDEDTPLFVRGSGTVLGCTFGCTWGALGYSLGSLSDYKHNFGEQPYQNIVPIILGRRATRSVKDIYIYIYIYIYDGDFLFSDHAGKRFFPSAISFRGPSAIHAI